MKTQQRSRRIVVCLFVLILAGCGWRPKLMDRFTARGYTEKQKLIAFYEAHTLFLEDEGDGKVQRVAYWRLKPGDIRKEFDEMAQDYENILSYTNKELTHYVDSVPGMRDAMTHKENVILAMRARALNAELYPKFLQLTGSTPSYDVLAEKQLGYDPAKVFGSKDLRTDFRYEVPALTEARENGTLQLAGETTHSTHQKFGKKKPDPDNPDDSNAYIWIEVRQDLKLRFWKIGHDAQPEDNKPDLIEGFRLVDGNEESLPALKIFFVNASSYNQDGVVVLDKDRDGDPGFGLPDFVEKMFVGDVVHDSRLMAMLFEDKRDKFRVPPKRQGMMIEIAKVGEKVFDGWITSQDHDGWPMPKGYVNEQKTNYNIKLVFEPTKDPNAKSRRIKYVRKEWTAGKSTTQPSVGRVVEYFEPKPPYNELLADARIDFRESTKRLMITRIDGSEERLIVMPGVNNIIGDKPMLVDYTAGPKRYRLRRTEGSEVFNQRKVISNMLGRKTGDYFSTDDELDSGGSTSPHHQGGPDSDYLDIPLNFHL